MIGRGEKNTIFLSMILIDSCMIIHYIVEENIFEEILKRHIKDCFKINGKKTIKMPKKDEYVKFKNFERKIKSPFMIYADFESILVHEDNGKQNNPDESYTNKYQNMLFVVMVINYVIKYGYVMIIKYVLMINLVSLLNHT